MAREVVIQVTCDLCKDKFDESDGVSNFKLQANNDPMIEFDACDGCADSLVPFFNVARNVIIPKAPKKPKQKQDASLHPKAGYQPPDPDRTLPCPVKKCDFMGKSTQSLATHNARMHKEKS